MWKRNPFLVHVDEPEDNSGSTSDSGLEYNSSQDNLFPPVGNGNDAPPEKPLVNGDGSDATEKQREDFEEGFNPAWNELLNELPDGFQNTVAPHLKKWDDNWRAAEQKHKEELQEVQSKYSPIQEFVDNGVPVEQVADSFKLAQALNDNPEQFYKEIGAWLGYDQGQQNKSEDTSNSEYEDSETEYSDLESNPKFQELKQQYDSLADTVQNKQQQEEEDKMAAQYQEQIDSELGELKEKFENDGKAFEPSAILKLAIANSGEDGEYDLATAANEYAEMISNATQSNQKKAPQVMGTTGGFPADTVDLDRMSTDDNYRQEALANLLKGTQ